MIQEDKQLLLKDLCARLPYGVKIQKINEPESAYRLYSIDTNSEELKFVTFEGSSLSIYNGGYLARAGKLRFKPYLRPMSNMTEEEKEELKKLFDAKEVTIESLGFIEGGTLEDYISQIPYDFCGGVTDWLNEHHFDYRRLIEKGLAIKALNDMYKI